jgi:apolipoprotein N-acyltransferase
VLLALAYPPAALLLPAFVGLVPLLVFIAEQPVGVAGRWTATRAGLLTGSVYFGLQLYWLAIALSPESLLAIPAYILSVMLLAGFAGGFAWALHYTRERLSIPLALLAAVLWTTLEWSQGRLGDLAFPWLGLGHALAPFPRLAGAADLVGARGLTLWVVAINGLLAMALVRYRAADGGVNAARSPARSAWPPGRLLGAAALVFVIPAAYGFWRAATLEIRPVARVAVVQPNIPQAIRRDPAVALDTSMIMLTRLTMEAADRGLDLIAWPEVAVTANLEADQALIDAVRELSRQAGAPILAGAFGGDRTGEPLRQPGQQPGHRSGRRAGHSPEGRLGPFNSALLVGPDGPIGPRYDKRQLVAFVERVPFVRPDSPDPGSGRSLGRLRRGTSGPVLRVADAVSARAPGTATAAALQDGPAADPGAAFGVLICFESAFADLARRYRRDGADFLVNITNDAWFGREPWYTRTTALWQHPAHMTMRAIENRVGVARSANTGTSLFIDPLGRTRQATSLFSHDVRTDTVFTTDSVTLFVRWGDWLATLAALTAAALLIAARRTSGA